MSLTETERMMQGRIGIDKSERIRRPASQSEKGPPQAAPKLNASGQLASEEVAIRRSGTVANEVVVGDLRSEETSIYLSYAVLTQRGYHPDGELWRCCSIVMHRHMLCSLLVFMQHIFHSQGV